MSSPDSPDQNLPPSRSTGTKTNDEARTRDPDFLGVPLVEEGELLAGRFSIQQQIGRGGAGTVFSAFDIKVGQRVAVKVLHADVRDASQLERLRREVRASRPGHPNAVAVYDLFDDGRRRFLTMELIDGRSLSTRLASGEPPLVDGIIDMGRQIAAALTDLHAKGLVHRDVKPGNILLTPDGNAKLCDMGLARSTMRGGTITETEMVVGTPAYMAPEQALAGDLTAASDVYALGLTLYQCLTGEVPLQEDTAVATLMLRQKSPAPRVRSASVVCPRWLERLIRRMLDPDPDRRPSAGTVENALMGRRFAVRLRPRRRHVLGAVIGALVVAGSIFGYRAFSTVPAASVETIGSDIVGFDESGTERWRHRLEQERVEALRADLDGDGSDEVLVVGKADPEAGGLSNVIRHSQILILDASGEIITRLDPERKIGSWPYRYRLEVSPELHALDLDRDGWIEVVAVCGQRRYFPTEVLVYWPRWNVWDKVLSHPGSIYEVFPQPEGSPPGFRFLAVNNRLAMFMILGEMAVTPPGLRGEMIKGRPVGVEAPPFGSLRIGPSGGLNDYVPLAPQQTAVGRDGRSLEAGPDGGWTVTILDESVDLDVFLNPVGGPNFGRDLRDMRVEYYRLLYGVRYGIQTFTSEGIEKIRSAMTTLCGPLLREPQYETIFIDVMGRALARADDVEGAIELLRPSFSRLRNDDLGYRLANLEAIAGDLEAAESVLRTLMDQGRTRRSGFDAPQLMLRVAIEARNADLFGVAMSYLTGLFRDSPERLDVRAAVWAGARLWWDESSSADARVRSMDYVEDGDAVSCLIRWRRGESRGDDPEAMRLLIENNPDAAGIGRAALAAALLGTGLTAEAIEECDRAVNLLGEWAKADFKEYQSLQLVKGIRVVALLESGDRELARREARRLVDELDPDLLPGILIAEVLAETGD